MVFLGTIWLGEEKKRKITYDRKKERRGSVKSKHLYKGPVDKDSGRGELNVEGGGGYGKE